ncbi:MAG TPA: restriction endonuclease subunit S [Pseudomonadales bacterium]
MSFDYTLPNGWAWETIDSIKAEGRSIVSGPFGSAIGSRFFVESGVPVIRGNNLKLGMERFFDGGFVFLSEEKALDFKNCEAVHDDIILTAAGTIGQVGIIPKTSAYPKYIISNKQIRVRTDQQKVMPLFVYYWLSSSEMTNTIQSRNTGSTIPLINLSVVKSLPIPVPPLKTQKAIVEILGCLDDRIALLRETNATLEAIAQALFKSWFVDFDPVHANAAFLENGQTPSLPAEIQALFPSRLVESPQGLIPEGWEWVSLKEATQIFDSKRVPLSGQDRAKRKGPYPYYGAASLMDWVDDYIFDGVYLLMGEDGSVADKNGFPITQYVWGKIWVNNHAHVLQGKNGISTEHLMLAVKGINIQPYMTGAVQAKLSQSNMWRIQFLMPTKCVAEAFAKHIEPLFTKIRANSEQAITLENLRDALLPRLISGQLRLPEAEAALAEVAP